MHLVFWFYAAVGVATLLIYRPLSSAAAVQALPSGNALDHSRRIVFQLAALFSLDSLGSGFFVQSLLALWLFKTFHLSVLTASSILFWMGLCSAVSYLIAVPISERFGLINTMVFTHLPANVLLVLVPFAPNLPVAIGLLVARSALSEMDVPTRTSYVMAVVKPDERAATASIHRSSQKSCKRTQSIACRLSAECLGLRLAANLRRLAQSRLRSTAALPVSRREATRGELVAAAFNPKVAILVQLIPGTSAGVRYI